MISKIKTFVNIGLEGYVIDVEVDSNRALPKIEIVGLPDSVVNESRERIRWTFRNMGIDIPSRKIILNLAPSDIKKTWTRFDLPMAVGIVLLIYPECLDKEFLKQSVFMWELGLDGSVRKVNWILPSVISAYKKGYKRYFIPYDNLPELKYIQGIDIYPIKHFSQIVDYLLGYNQISVYQPQKETFVNNQYSQADIFVDYNEIKWHIFAKRVMQVCVSWMHNLLMIWPPWSWKTILAKALSGILPPLSFEETLEVSQIYSILWHLNFNCPVIKNRPFRHLHHTASKMSIVWGWNNLYPWEVSLAHKWVLFFDEIPEFPREVLEVLRQPIEDKKVTISRVNWTVVYPCDFMLVWAMNPCKCWYYLDKEKVCNCSENWIKRYQSKVSWPLLDRFDAMIEVPRENVDILFDDQNTSSVSSDTLRQNVLDVRNIQQKRFKDELIYLNSQMSNKQIFKYANMDIDAEKFMKLWVKSLHLSPRQIYKLVKISRSIADVAWSKKIMKNHIAEAFQYRSKNLLMDSAN